MGKFNNGLYKNKIKVSLSNINLISTQISLMMIYILIDSRRQKLLEPDIEFIKDLKKSKSNFTILLTKIDQLKEKDEMNEIFKNIFNQLIKLNEEEKNNLSTNQNNVIKEHELVKEEEEE